MKASTLFSRLLAPVVLGVVLVASASPAVAAPAEKTLVVFSFENATAGVGGNSGDRVVLASYLRESALTSATFSWTDPDGVFPNAIPGTFYDHGVQAFGWDGPGDKVFSARGTGPAWDFSQGGTGYTHFVITLTAKKPWLLSSFSMQQGANDPPYWVDIVAVQGNAATLLGSVSVGGAVSVVSLPPLAHIFAEGPAQILILPTIPSPTGSGYFAVDDVTLKGTWNP